MSVDRERIASRISDVQVAMEQLEKYAVMDADEFVSNSEKVAASKYHLLTMIEGCISICTHIAAREIHKVPEGYGTCFKLLAENNLIDEELANSLSRMAGFRNLLIHQYWEIDNHNVHKYIISGKEDVKTFIQITGDRYLK
ncbi:MAG: DUF86 domain-containing protein [Nitrospirae bacterium]|nr:DUF86 domain-containing protein [Nitrospirota bacterium]